jgi:hypothetical protein
MWDIHGDEAESYRASSNFCEKIVVPVPPEYSIDLSVCHRIASTQISDIDRATVRSIYNQTRTESTPV